MRTWRVALIVGLIGGSCGSAHATDRYVAQTNQPPSGGYTSWATAASNIQTVVTIADPNDIIYIGEGTYTNSGTEVVGINQSLQLIGVGDREKIVIDGQGARRGIYSVLTSGSPYIRIEGLTVVNGSNTVYGAGLGFRHTAVSAGTVVVHNCVIQSNFTTSSAGVWDGGGAGVWTWGQADSPFLTEISDCLIRNNTFAGREGGAGVMGKNARVIVRNCHIVSNTVDNVDDSGGGVLLNAISAGSEISDSVIEYNACGYEGGGIYITAIAADAPVVIRNCRIEHNSANYGGGLGLHWGGKVRLYGCQIGQNSSLYGGGIVTMHSTDQLVVNNCTIVTNQTTHGFGGAGICLNDGSVTVTNSIVYHNRATGAQTARQNYYGVNNDIEWSFSCTQPEPVGNGNITNNPAWIDVEGGDYRLSRLSPCIDAGTNLPWMVGAVDLDDNRRRDGTYGKVDMGCYEYQPTGTSIMVQ